MATSQNSQPQIANRQPLGVLQVGTALDGWAGIEKYVMYLTEGLKARGHEVHTTVRPNSPLARRMPTAKAITVRNKIDPTALAAYIRLLRSNRFDIVHTHFNRDFVVPALAAKLVGGPKLVMTRHVCLPWPKSKSRLYSRLYDCIVPVSDAVRHKLKASGVPESKMIVAKAGCPPLETVSVADLGSGFKIGYFGRIAEEKGIRVLLEAANSLSASSEIAFHVFGEGPLSPLVAASTLPNLRLHGFQPDITSYLAAVDAVVVPSIWEEAFPYAVLEAMSCGKAIIASNIGGLPEMVQDGVNGALFRPGDAANLAETIKTLYANAGQVEAMGSEGRRIQIEQFTVEKMAERMESVYDELAD